jgi:hypothetical protein
VKRYWDLDGKTSWYCTEQENLGGYKTASLTKRLHSSGDGLLPAKKSSMALVSPLDNEQIPPVLSNVNQQRFVAVKEK